MTGEPRDITVLADGAAVDDQSFALLGMRLKRSLGRPSVLTLRYALDDALAPIPLAKAETIELRLDGTSVFTGHVVGLRRSFGPDGIDAVVTAEDALSRLARGWSQSTGEIPSIKRFIGDLAQRYGIAAVVDGWSDFGVGRHLNVACNDLDHLVGMAERYGLGVSMRSDGVHVTDLTGGAARGGHRLDADRIVSMDETRLTAFARPVARWSGWTASDDRTVHGDQAAAGPGHHGVAVREGEPTGRIAAAVSARAEALTITLRAELRGLLDIWPGEDAVSPVEGADPVRLGEVELRIDAAEGARTVLRSWPGDAPDAAAEDRPVIVTGTVAETGDPLASGRVRVDLHGHLAATTAWLPVSGLNSRVAGGGGLSVPLAVGDPVIIAAPGRDPNLGVVLGGLLRAGPDAARRGRDETRQVWRADGAVIDLNDTDGTLRVAMENGAGVTIDGGNLTLSAPGDFVLACDGRVRICGTRIDFERP